MGLKVSKARVAIQRPMKLRLETGFSMLEAVVVVGVLLALAVSGFFAYGPIAENAKRAKVKSVASEIHTAVLVASIDGDSTTQPQDVIEDWNSTTDKIRVEILEAGFAAMTTTLSPSANGDFCVQATNVESPHITAREGSCADVTDDSSTGSLPDADGDGIPDETDPDIDGNGTPNTPWESYNVVKDKQAAGNEVSYVNASSGGITTWNYDDSSTYGHSHDPISPNLLTSPQLDILQVRSNSEQSVTVTIGTDGSMNNSTGAVGGSFAVYFHADFDCVNTGTNAIRKDYGKRGSSELTAAYLGGNPPPSTGSLTWGCSGGERINNFVLRPISEAEFNDPAPRSYNFTKNQIVHWTR